jgi:predicted nuclease of predicted toxin-antitoxin system
MHILADENMPSSVIAELRLRGHDVLSVKESLVSEDDITILARAQTEGRTVVTRDKDFGELAYQFGLPATCGVILFRLPNLPRDETIRRMLDVIESRTDWAGMFAVATDSRVRIRPLPT